MTVPPRAPLALRTPLYPLEADASPTTVAVTGATGFIAGALMHRLLVAGHTVHATARDVPRATVQCAPLLALPGAAARLKLFAADFDAPASFDAPLAGATVVFHTASPVALAPPRGHGRRLLVDPALAGVDAVLGAATRSPTVTRVVVTSSIVALLSSVRDRAPGHVFGPDDWNDAATPTYLPYYASKVAAERRAYELEATQSRWTLVTICAGSTLGPPATGFRVPASESVAVVRDLLRGGLLGAVPASATGFVDIDDVAAAHTLAGFTPGARGRYVVSAESMSMLQVAALLRPAYGGAFPLLPARVLPTRVVWFATRVLGVRLVDYDLVAASAGDPPRFDTTRTTCELGVVFRPVQRAVLDMVDAMVDAGIVRPSWWARRRLILKEGRAHGPER